MAKLKYPPCDGDCEHCLRPADKCYGGNAHEYHTPYAPGTLPRRVVCKGKQAGAIPMTSGNHRKGK